MYTLISAIGKTKDAGGRWYEISIGDQVLSTLFQQYRSIFLKLHNEVVNADITFDLLSLTVDYYYSPLTVNEFLIGLGDKALAPAINPPTLKSGYVKYVDAFHAGYTITPVFPNAAADAQLPEADKTAVKLTKSGLDPVFAYNNCLVTVNGFFHLIDADTSGVYVMDANTSKVLANNNQVGIYSFREVGSLKHIPITDSMILKQTNKVPLSTKLYIKLDQAIGEQTPIISIGGYLHVLDSSVCYQVADDMLCVELLNVSLYERIFESKQYIDLSSLGLIAYQSNPSLIERAELMCDDVIRKYLTLSQSFVVLVNNADLFVERKHIENTPGPGMMITARTPDLPLVSGYGKYNDYWYTFEDGLYSVNCVDNLRHNRLFRTANVDLMPALIDSDVPTQTVTISHSYFLYIGTDKA